MTQPSRPSERARPQRVDRSGNIEHREPAGEVGRSVDRQEGKREGVEAAGAASGEQNRQQKGAPAGRGQKVALTRNASSMPLPLQ